MILFCLFEEEINTFNQQACIKVIKSDSKDIYNITKDLFSNKCFSFKHFIKGRVSYFSKMF